MKTLDFSPFCHFGSFWAILGTMGVQFPHIFARAQSCQIVKQKKYYFCAYVTVCRVCLVYTFMMKLSKFLWFSLITQPIFHQFSKSWSVFDTKFYQKYNGYYIQNLNSQKKMLDMSLFFNFRAQNLTFWTKISIDIYEIECLKGYYCP